MLRTIFRSRLLSRVAPHYNPTCQSVTSKLLNISQPAFAGYFRTTFLHYNNCTLTYEYQKHDKHQTDEMYKTPFAVQTLQLLGSHPLLASTYPRLHASQCRQTLVLKHSHPNRKKPVCHSLQPLNGVASSATSM
jgi:hypothetical protein